MRFYLNTVVYKQTNTVKFAATLPLTASCKECLARGVPCRSQELPKPEHPRESDRALLNERLARVESLLEQLLIRVEDGGKHEERSKLPIEIECSTPATVTPAPDNVPVLSLFSNETLVFQRPDDSANKFRPYGSINRDWGRLRHDLLVLIPSQKTLEILSDFNSTWWLMRIYLVEDYDKTLV
ncbi:transcriptional regulator family: Fungal Specific TF [Penicillium paradoxum]|uniref:transcriptional regulator family: Fungal Specific TF n=1 Tax=Penicillium paradoxum TaxID=176176 RepID=UPI002547DC42|nr:transcriptional regulator family: Fungal Specific TF [Penicillium paradoxum]KAJ5779357.1 transcriptional regulator family: Fungal Specific TF [Penicillium paradoxum]